MEGSGIAKPDGLLPVNPHSTIDRFDQSIESRGFDGYTNYKY
jgi:hypothetical protein